MNKEKDFLNKVIEYAREEVNGFAEVRREHLSGNRYNMPFQEGRKEFAEEILELCEPMIDDNNGLLNDLDEMESILYSMSNTVNNLKIMLNITGEVDAEIVNRLTEIAQDAKQFEEHIKTVLRENV